MYNIRVSDILHSVTLAAIVHLNTWRCCAERIPVVSLIGCHALATNTKTKPTRVEPPTEFSYIENLHYKRFVWH